ncbi:MAG: transcriptional repressor [Clostridia bacterium]|nr:transcriptional repressor [Clostridia bacterium]
MGEIKYNTKQREEILELLKANRDRCLTAREICGMVKAGEATVFRTLSALAKEGTVSKFLSGGTPTYQLNECGAHHEHIHLKCSECGKLIHSDCSFIEELEHHFEKDHSFKVDRSKTVIYGICSECGRGGGQKK